MKVLALWTLLLASIAAFTVFCSPDEGHPRTSTQKERQGEERANLVAPRQASEHPHQGTAPLNETALEGDPSPPDPSTTALGAGAFRLPSDLAAGFTPTREGLEDLTIGLWEQGEFLSMPWEEFSKLLPIDETLPPQPGTLGELVGGLPTVGDFDNAMRDDLVCELLFELQTAEVWLALAYERPHERRGPRYEERVGKVKEARRSAALHLMSRLEQVTGYRHWTLLWSLHEAWETGQ